MYFFGWNVLFIVLGLFVLITIAVMIHDYFAFDHGLFGHESEDTSFWLVSDKKLGEIGQILEAAGIIKPYDVDGENVWEWIETGSPAGDFQFNISRKHKDYNYPVRIKVNNLGNQSHLEMREQLGTQLARTLKSDIKVGSVKYLSGNDFEFNEEGFFKFTGSN